MNPQNLFERTSTPI